MKENELKIYFIDVGQGNTDKYDYGKNVVLPYLLDRKISKIDYMIISHVDSDHIGGLMAIVEGIRVDKILIGIQPESSKQFEELFFIAKQKRIEEIAEDIISEAYNKKLKSNILKAAHHGSITSSSYNIFQNINPQIVLIGVGKDNKFGHPSEEVIDRFNDMGSRIYRTDIHGEINLKINKNGKIKINTKNK